MQFIRTLLTVAYHLYYHVRVGVSVYYFIFISYYIIYLGGKYNEYYWKKRQVTFFSKNKFLGMFWNYVIKDRALFEYIQDMYKMHPNEPAVAFGSLFKPSLCVIDPTNIQYVFSEFNCFNERGFSIVEEDLLAQNLLFIRGKKWKVIRHTLSPLFTSSKLRSMFYIIDKSAQDFIIYVKENPTFLKDNVFKTLSRFCSAAMCAAIFGISTKSIFDSPFLDVAEFAFKSSLSRDLKFSMSLISASLINIFNIKLFNEFEDFFIGAIKQAIRQRKSENVKGHDFIDLCVSLQSKGMLKDIDNEHEIKPTDELLAAQAFFFFIAGVDPTASTIFHCLVLLGKHPEILQRLQEEIDDVFEKCEGNLKYDAIIEMRYLDMVLNESMRIYPAIGYLVRKCAKDTILPTGNIKIDRGTSVFIPLLPAHIDSKYYSDPEVFDPERFLGNIKTPMTEKPFMPFGKGGRSCIGMRYAQLQVKACLIHLLRNFSVKTQPFIAKFSKEQVQAKLKNVNVEFIERKVKL